MAKYNFYYTAQWEAARQHILSKRNGICEVCGGAGWILHHVEHINDGNANDVSKVWGEDNIKLVCQDCHNRIHHANNTTAEGLMFDSEGQVVQIAPVAK